MDALRSPFTPNPAARDAHPTSARTSMAAPGEAGAFAGPIDAASRIRPWLTAIAGRLREAFGDFPDAIWLTTPACTLAAECDEDGRWRIDSLPMPTPSQLRALAPELSALHEVDDAARDPVFDESPTTLRWPMARRLCRIVFDDAPGGGPRSVMMLVGSLPGRMSDTHRITLQEWLPAASAMLAMVIDAGDVR